MRKYTFNQILKILEKLSKKEINTTNKIKKIKWEDLDKIDESFTPIEKSLVMDFRDAVIKKKLVEFLMGNEEDEKND